MTDALDKGYNEGRLAFRRYFAKYGPNVNQNDPRMPPNPYVGYYGSRGSTGSSLNCAASSRLLRARADSATSRSGFAFVERAEKRLSARRPFRGRRRNDAGESQKPRATLYFDQEQSAVSESGLSPRGQWRWAGGQVWADSAPTAVASGRTGVRAIAAIPLRERLSFETVPPRPRQTHARLSQGPFNSSSPRPPVCLPCASLR